MASKKPTLDAIVTELNDLKLKPSNGTSTKTADFYEGRSDKDRINFARLEKGLLLFIYLYETAKSTMASEIALWDHRLCYNVIKDGKCTKTSDQCRREHQTTYRQSNLCAYWYIGNSCTFNSKCKHAHQLQEVARYHRYIQTETEAHVYQLIRFVRNFAGHFIDSVINDPNDQQNLYRDVIIAMVHVVHFLSPRAPDSIEHLNLFLEATTINQLIAKEKLLVELEKPSDIPEVFFDLAVNFNAYWYHRNGSQHCVEFHQLVPAFTDFFHDIFTGYFEGRLRSRGAKAPWHENSKKT